MGKNYLTVFFALLALGVGGLLSFTYSADPFGLYVDDSEASMSRIDQFYHMRSSKPLQLLRKRPEQVILGSSRTARVAPSDLSLTDIYNAAIPGATATEVRDLLLFTHRNQRLERAYIGWDFEAFLGLTPDRRAGFKSDLLQAGNPLSRWIYAFIAHKRTLFSFVAIKEAIAANNAVPSPIRPSYLSDGSWRRNQLQNIGPLGFALISKDKIEHFRHSAPHSLSTREVTDTLAYCYETKIDCRVFLTPVHLFHFELFEATGLLPLWENWHREAVAINEKLAASYNTAPLPIWGFNAVEQAVSERVSKPTDLDAPWFTDNLHFRPRFGALMLKTLHEDSAQAGALKLTTQNVEEYIEAVGEMRKRFLASNARQVRRMRKNYGIDATVSPAP